MRSVFCLSLLLLVPSAYAQLPAGAVDTTAQPVTAPLDPLFVEANSALDKQDYPTALKLLTALAAKKPNDAHILYNLAFAQDALDQTTEATATYRRASAADTTFFEPHLSLGLLLARNGQTKEARAELTSAIALNAPDPAFKARAWRALARLDQLANDPGAASTDLLAAIKLSPETPSDILLSAELAEEAGDLPASETAYRRLLAVEPGDLDATAGLVHLLVRERKPSEAETLLTAALAKSPDDITLNAQLASLYASQDKVADAIPIVEKLHATQPQNSPITRQLASLYSHDSQFDKAEPLYAALMASNPQDLTLLNPRATSLLRLRRSAEAETLLLKPILTHPEAFPTQEDLAEAASTLAFASSENSDPKTTLQALEIRGKVLPQSPSSLFLAATAHDKLHHVKLASDLYKQFLSVANGKFPNEEWEASHRLLALDHMK
jgi:tetratricopeptide (TPR) repeat protein